MTIAIARDEAFNFSYPANEEALSRGAECVYFSPLRDKVVPSCDLIYLPGGYPELHAETLAANESMKESIRAHVARGGRIFAECGGFMYLCKAIDHYPMCNIFPFEATMDGARLRLGYRRMGTMRGHEFHYSALRPCADLPSDVTILQAQTTATGKRVDTAIYRRGNAVGGYTHWYWAETGFNALWNACTL